MTTGTTIADWTTALRDSEERMLNTVADGGVALAHGAAIRMVAAWALSPAPSDPVQHLEVARAEARSHLVRLVEHDAAREISGVMTAELFVRLTAGRPTPLTAPRGARRYTYTSRKVLRRVLDHALDHLNQIDQWLAWRRHGIVPSPTDGWASSVETLQDDRLPLDSRDLRAWLWRVDQAARLLIQGAHELSEVELDWPPPDGGWPLRRVLHHVARSELLYARALDDVLPEDPRSRYTEACLRLDERVGTIRLEAGEPSALYVGLYGSIVTRCRAGQDVLTIEHELAGADTASCVACGA
jgi:hypothetical protein